MNFLFAVRILVSSFAVILISSCVKSGARSEEVEAPPIVVTTRNLQNFKARCATSDLSNKLEHQVMCNAVVEQNGSEVPVESVPPGVHFDWNSLKVVSGIAPQAIDCSVSFGGLTETCRVVLNSPEVVTLETTLTSTLIGSSEQISNTAQVILPVTVKTFGLIRELPKSFALSSANGTSNASFIGTPQNSVSRPRLAEIDFDARQSPLVVDDEGVQSCSLGSEVFVSARNYIYRIANNRLSLFSGAPTWKVPPPKSELSRREMVFISHPSIECVEGSATNSSTLYAVTYDRVGDAKTGEAPRGRLIFSTFRGDQVKNALIAAPELDYYAKIKALAIGPSGDWYFVAYTKAPGKFTGSQIFKYHPGAENIVRLHSEETLPGVQLASDITVSPDETIYFSDVTSNKLYRLLTDHTLQAFMTAPPRM